MDFAGLPEMARTFLQVAAGAADIPVTRLLGQSPSGLSATGESDVRNYYDMIAARQELDLRPQLERLDRLIFWSEGIDEGALGFAFRPLWQLDEPARAALALQKAQATQVYAGLKLWPDAVTARLAEAQLVADGTYPNAAAVFAQDSPYPLVESSSEPITDYVGQPRNPLGQFAEGRRSTFPLISPVSKISRGEQFRRQGTGGPPPAVETPYSAPFRIDPRAFPWIGSGQGTTEVPSASPEIGQQSHIKPPQDAYDPDGPKAPGKPPSEKGFRDPKSGENWVRNPNGRGYGWEDDKGDVWVPTGQGGSAHGGPHWDVQSPGGGYRNEKPLREQW